MQAKLNNQNQKQSFKTFPLEQRLINLLIVNHILFQMLQFIFFFTAPLCFTYNSHSDSQSCSQIVIPPHQQNCSPSPSSYPDLTPLPKHSLQAPSFLNQPLIIHTPSPYQASRHSSFSSLILLLAFEMVGCI